jgi:hypothetical protein
MILATHGIIKSQAVAVALLLDTYTNAAAAYSVRKLRSAYSGSCIRVRRSSDNTEQDIGFSGTNLDTTALTSFCSGTNGFVTTWYDQSGNANDATQTTAANQPQIVSSGSVITENTRPTLQFDGSNDAMFNTAFTVPKYIFGVFNPKTAISYEGFLNYSAKHFFLRDALLTSLYSDAASLYSIANNYVNNANTKNFANSALQLFANGQDTPTDGASRAISFGTSTGGGTNASTNICEVIAFVNNENSNRTAISTNINTYYAMY